MTFSIKYKLMLTLLVTVVVVVGAMFLLTKWSFDRGFMNYVSSVEKDMQSNLVQKLADEYKDAGGWQPFRDNPRLWFELNADSLMHAGGRHPRAFSPRETPPGPPPGSWHGHQMQPHPVRPRMVLFDADKTQIVGRLWPGERIEYKPIEVDGKTVGYLGVPALHDLLESRDLRFSRGLTHAFTNIALALAVAFALIALPVARQLVRPIQELSLATRRLASGRYDTRIAVTGNDELGLLARDFNSLSNTLEHNEKARRQWIADISHELRTPLSVLQGEIEAMQDGVRDCTPERLKQLHAQTLNLSRLVNDLYELSLSDLGALSYHKLAVDVSGILDESLQELLDGFLERNISVEAPRATGHMKAFADPDRLKQMFLNVLNNSLRYTDAGGQVKVELARLGGKLLIDIQDSAPGVAAEHLPRLFDRLYRVDESRSRATGGAGLGLAIARNIAEAHEGHISARSSPLGGVWIRIELPAEPGAT